MTFREGDKVRWRERPKDRRGQTILDYFVSMYGNGPFTVIQIESVREKTSLKLRGVRLPSHVTESREHAAIDSNWFRKVGTIPKKPPSA